MEVRKCSGAGGSSQGWPWVCSPDADLLVTNDAWHFQCPLCGSALDPVEGEIKFEELEVTHVQCFGPPGIWVKREWADDPSHLSEDGEGVVIVYAEPAGGWDAFNQALMELARA